MNKKEIVIAIVSCLLGAVIAAGVMSFPLMKCETRLIILEEGLK